MKKETLNNTSMTMVYLSEPMDVIMLPTNKSSNLCLSKKSNTLHFTNYPIKTDETMLSQYLYFVSNANIIIGDWFYSDEYSQPEQAEVIEGNLVNGFIKSACKKIEATTDSSLKIKEEKVLIENERGSIVATSLPMISQSFVEHYSRLNGNIKKVKVEMEYLENPAFELKYPDGDGFYVKVTTDNTVIVKEYK